MTTSGIPFRKQQPAGNDYMTPKQLIGSFRLGCGYYVITHRPRNINWVPHGLDSTRSFDKPPVIRLASRGMWINP